jgi:anti-anti-sigma factor
MIKTRTEARIAILEVHGPLTASEGDSGLRKAVRAALDAGARTVILNLGDVPAVDSSGVAQLASGHLTSANQGARFKLCCLSQKLKDVFVITRLNSVFDAYETEADAIASVKTIG